MEEIGSSSSMVSKNVMEEIGCSSSMESKNVKVIGIDLGTTYSRVGYWVRNQLLTQGIPSCIAFTDDTEEHIVGDKAFDGVDENPSNTVLDVKRLIGAKFSDNNTKLDILRSSVEVIQDPLNMNQLSVVVRSFNQQKRFSPEELLCMILRELKQIAEKGLDLKSGDVIFKAVISVPSCYNNGQRLATKRAATMAGFEDSRLINETTATALAYGWLKKKMKSRQDQKQKQHGVEARTPQEDEENVLIFDLGGGALSVAVLNIKDGWNTYKVMSVAGDTHLGGKDFTDLLSLHCSDKFNKIQNDDCLLCARSKSRLRFACEAAKRLLDYPEAIQTVVDYPKKAIPLSVSVKRDKFAEECQKLFDRCEEEVDQCVQTSGIYRFHEVIVVGGSTRIWRIREMLSEFCIPAQGFCEIVNPDVAVVQGAAIQAAMWSEEALSNPLLKGIKVTDVAALTLGTKTLPHLIPRTTGIPIVLRRRLTTERSDQRSFCVGVYEGGNEMEGKNLIGNFIFDGIQATEMGSPNITVTFAVDRDGILNVSASQGSEDRSRIRQLARQVINRSLTPDELNQFGREMEREESNRMKLEARMKVSLFVNRCMSEELLPGVSPSQAEIMKGVITEAQAWLEDNELPEVQASEFKLVELQAICYLILRPRRAPK